MDTCIYSFLLLSVLEVPPSFLPLFHHLYCRTLPPPSLLVSFHYQWFCTLPPPSLLVSFHCRCPSLPPAAPAQLAQQPEDLPEGMYRCEFCGHVEHKAKFLAPSRRFCSLTCCKRLGDLRFSICQLSVCLSVCVSVCLPVPPSLPSFIPALLFIWAYWRAKQASKASKQACLVI